MSLWINDENLPSSVWEHGENWEILHVRSQWALICGAYTIALAKTKEELEDYWRECFPRGFGVL
jgi:hypothetical protein